MRAVLLAALCLAAIGPALAQEIAPLDLYVRLDKGSCISCHALPDGAGPATRANVASRLTGSRMRELGKAKLVAIVSDPTQGNPETVMPPFGRHRILEPREIDRLVDYLHALP
jgi:sulfur-oxidizing protein SoxX